MKPLHEPVYVTIAFRQTGNPELSDRGFDLKYSREENPTVRELERSLSALESGRDSLAFNSGMGAISCLYLSQLSAGDEVVLPMEGYGTSIQLAEELGKFGVKVKLAYPDASSLVEAISEETRLVFLETITNPTLKVIDVPEVIKKAKEVGAKVVVDNTFSPLVFKPLKHGASGVVHSLSKYIAGHNDVLGGAIILGDLDIEELWHWRRRLGSIIQPIEAWLVLRGIKTLEVRFERMSGTAKAVAEFLSEHPKVRTVHYPGLKDNPHHETARRLFEKPLFGGVVSFDLGSEREAERFLSSLRRIFPSPSLGGTESLATYPSKSAAKTMPRERREKLGITPGLIRLSVGLEPVEELIEDIDRALGGG
ncbi:cystathionine gamma-synthase family protein [Thermococcus waiotapuensis]|uniref:Cystathionine gamma-synthase family protein n=1 Tax=Thermococcus waiotapuensis TaxID=90909 RepID=A0AAE4T2X0_9EURY|nr:cystathionine gamma-synthase family protein [Thermococcus waiotapuensis]MDV3103238.1 cystathionine gamma-synthase family protein [Thermococcus waiotapuensis]